MCSLKKIISDSKHIFKSLFSVQWLINNKITYTQHQHSIFNGFGISFGWFVIESHNAHTQCAITKTMDNFSNNNAQYNRHIGDTMCYFKLIYGTFMDIGPLMVAIDSIYNKHTKEKRNWKSFFLHSSYSSYYRLHMYTRQQSNSIVNNEHLFQSCWHCNALFESIQFKHSNERFVFLGSAWNWVSSLFLSYIFFSPPVLFHCSL